MKHELIKIDDYLLVVSDKEIKRGDFPKYSFLHALEPLFDAVLTHHEPILEDGYIGKEIIAHLPLGEAPILEGVDLLPPVPKQEDNTYKYTEEDILNALEVGYQIGLGYDDDNPNTSLAHIIHIKDGYIKSLNKPKLPIAFESETDNILSYNADDGIDALVNPNFGQPKKITNSEGRTEWVGTYIFN
jgi:hypothetical protein